MLLYLALPRLHLEEESATYSPQAGFGAWNAWNQKGLPVSTPMSRLDNEDLHWGQAPTSCTHITATTPCPHPTSGMDAASSQHGAELELCNFQLYLHTAAGRWQGGGVGRNRGSMDAANSCPAPAQLLTKDLQGNNRFNNIQQLVVLAGI